jgi:hypothetical protein
LKKCQLQIIHAQVVRVIAILIAVVRAVNLILIFQNTFEPYQCRYGFFKSW